MGTRACPATVTSESEPRQLHGEKQGEKRPANGARSYSHPNTGRPKWAFGAVRATTAPVGFATRGTDTQAPVKEGQGVRH